MIRKTLTTILLTSLFTAASAQVAADAAHPQTAPHSSGGTAGPKLSWCDFRPASSLTFNAETSPITSANKTAERLGVAISPSFGGARAGQPHKSAAVHYGYAASGTERENQTKDSWKMQAGTLDDGQKALLDVIPDCFDAGGLAVPYSITAGTLTVQPTYLGSTSQYHVFLFAYDDSWSNFDLRITLDGKGAMDVDPNLNIVYGAFTTDYFDINAYQGYYESYSAVSYRKNIVLGDANEDGNVDKSDTAVLVGHLLGRSQENSDADAMDTNADGSINVADVIGLSNIIKTKK